MKKFFYFLLFAFIVQYAQGQTARPDFKALRSSHGAMALNQARNGVKSRAVEQVLDSIHSDLIFDTTWVPQSRQWFGYENSLHVVDSESIDINFGANLPPQWMVVSSTVLTYDADPKLLELIESAYSSTAMQMLPFLRRTYTYDTENRIQLEELDVYDSGTWNDYGKLENFYGTGGNLQTTLGYFYEAGNSQWLLVTKDSLIFDANDKLIEEYSGFVEGDMLTYDQKFLYNYDADGNLAEELSFELDGSDWFPIGYDLYTYEPGRTKPATLVLQGYDDLTGNWVPFLRRFYFYHDEASAAPVVSDKGSLDCRVPNPLVLGTTIACEGGDSNLILTLTDLFGRELVSQPLSQPILAGKLPSGYYLLKVAGREGQAPSFQKLVFVAK